MMQIYLCHLLFSLDVVTVNQTIKQSANQSINQSNNHTISQSLSQSISQYVSQSVRQSISQSVGYPSSKTNELNFYRRLGWSHSITLTSKFSQKNKQTTFVEVSKLVKPLFKCRMDVFSLSSLIGDTDKILYLWKLNTEHLNYDRN